MQDQDAHKEQSVSQGTTPAAPPEAGDFQRAENENPRANANISNQKQEDSTTPDSVGSEITDGEDA